QWRNNHDGLGTLASYLPCYREVQAHHYTHHARQTCRLAQLTRSGNSGQDGIQRYGTRRERADSLTTSCLSTPASYGPPCRLTCGTRHSRCISQRDTALA